MIINPLVEMLCLGKNLLRVVFDHINFKEVFIEIKLKSIFIFAIAYCCSQPLRKFLYFN